MGKRLVAYFSASGVTKGLAEKLAEAIEADIFEIAPVEPYTEADLKWTNPLARCNREKAGKKDVAIKETVQDMDSYETLYIGFPIWYWAAPNIINTFVKQYDLSGKKIVLFATSGGSNIGKTAEVKPISERRSRDRRRRSFEPEPESGRIEAVGSVVISQRKNHAVHKTQDF